MHFFPPQKTAGKILHSLRKEFGFFPLRQSEGECAKKTEHWKQQQKGITAMTSQNQVKYVPAGTGPMYCGPGDRVSFLATGAETHGSCLIVEGVAAPGGGPPPHLHHFEDESFYVL